jgi:hypothetical protein
MLYSLRFQEGNSSLISNVLISKGCVGMDDSVGVDGASVDNPKNLAHVLKDDKLEVIPLACVIQKALKTDTKE